MGFLLDEVVWGPVFGRRVERGSNILPSGIIIEDWYMFHLRSWVTCLAVTEEGEIILIRQYRPCSGEEIWGLPAGTCGNEGNDLDKLRELMKHELADETGYVASEWTYLGFGFMHTSNSPDRYHMFLAKGCRQEAERHLDAAESIFVHPVSPGKLKRLLSGNEIREASAAQAVMLGLFELGYL